MENVNISPLKKEPVIWLPADIVEKVSVKLNGNKTSNGNKSEVDDLIDYINELLNPLSRKHLDVLKKITKNLTTYASSDLWPLLLEIVVSGLCYCHSNHSIRSSINGLIRKLPDADLGTVSSLTLETMFEMNGVELVAALLQTDFGSKVIVRNITFVLKFFATLLNQLYKEVHCSKLTTEIAKLHANIHSLSRTLLSVFKLIEITSIEEQSHQLLYSIISVLNLKGIPLEVQGNCSKILVLLLRQQQNGIQCIIEKITVVEDNNHSMLISLENTLPTRLNLSIAILTSLEIKELLEEQPSNGTILGGVILPFLLNSGYGFNETGLALLTARLMEQWQRKCYECFTAHQATLLQIEWNRARDRLLELILNGLEHQVDVVRHTSKEAFHYNVKIYILLQGDKSRIVNTILGMPRFKKSKYMALACLAKTELISFLISAEHSLAEELLHVATDVDLSSQVREVFNLLMLKDTEHTDEWMRRWLYPLLSAIEQYPNGQSFDSSLVDLLKQYPKTIYNVEIWCQGDCASRLAVYITALLACRKLGFLPTNGDAPDENLWNSVVNMDVLEQALEHKDEKLRLNALGVIVEGPKTSQLYSQLEVQWICQFISRNMVNHNAAFRQQFCSYIKKFLLKLRNGGVPLIGRNDTIVTSYRSFVFWLTVKCLIDLGPGSSFPRRFLSLQFLKLIQETIGLESNPKGLNISSNLGLPAISSLVDCFFDSYDVNKELALELLQSPPMITVITQDPKGYELISVYRKSSAALSQSLRSADTVAANFFFRWLIHLKFDSEEEVRSRHDWSLKTRNTFTLIGELIQILKDQLDAARKDVGQLAIDAPIYGVLSSVRLLLSDQQSRTEEMKNESWASILSFVIEICFAASAIASPVVTCESPEGFLPDFSDLPSQNLNAQTLLVSAWRTVKEVALLFGQISAWMLESDFRLIEDDVILKLGLHLKLLLLETKHRGAFEQVYCGFSQLCYALWRSSKPEIHNCPTSWLLELVQDLKDNDSAAKLCATRRSAGLPFIFQAILSPEVEMGSGELFKNTIESLLEIASNGKSNECRIHALNILRNLYRESRLNQVIGPYIARGLILSITGFEAPDWPERNSSTLLFGALMIRIFGVPKSKHDFQKKNSLTGRVFFQLYPSLYPFLLDRLRICVADIKSGGIHLHPSLFPMLVLLGRLHPPACEFSDSAFQLEPFIPLVRACGSSPVLKTRQLAAQALTPLLTTKAYYRLLLELWNSLPNCALHNELHGTLLQIHYFVKDSSLSPETRDLVFRMLTNKIERLVGWLRSCCYLIRYEAAEILRLVIDSETSIEDSVSGKCLGILRYQFQVFQDKPFYPLASQKFAGIAIPSDVISHTANAIELLKHPVSEVRLEVLQRLESLDTAAALPTCIWPALNYIIADKEEARECRIKALALVGRFRGYNKEQLEWMLQLYRETSDDIFRCTALGAAGRIMCPSNSDDLDLVMKWSEYLVESVSSTISFRQMVVESVARCVELLKIDGSLAASTEHGSILSNLWVCLLRCLIDDEEHIRTAAAAVVGDLGTGYWSQPSVATDKALKYLIDKIGSTYTMRVILLLFDMVLEEDEQSEEESQAFETGDSNVFREPLAHSVLLCQFIEQCIRQHVASPPDSDILAELLENHWKSLGNCDTTAVDLLSSNRRSATVYIVNVIKLFLVTKSLHSIHGNIAALHQCIHNWLSQLNPHWFTYSIQQLVFRKSV
ncbi:thyroid adenoma-associated protein homolog isoform X2 [Daphnia carinata]|uniref:thyroid adenoma-associated protein homolog isoform X2 n=1 Tax=Daphnia carinata TaxID=120202 RepID=UPI00257D39C9|nr:thyroid adenoma-associated protein homolog isoform X2 [Daphnia carinata]